MKNIIFKTAGLTLIELIITSMLVSVVLFGLFSVTTVLSTNSQDYGQRYLLASQTQATLNHILGNAALTVKDPSAGDPGFLENILLPGDISGTPNTFCFHQNVDYSFSPGDQTPRGTPGDYSRDRWLCYTKNSATQTFSYCSMKFNPGVSPWGATSCNNPPSTNSIFLGTDYGGGIFSVVNGVITLTLQNCLNDLAPSCFSASPDPVNNPQVKVTGSVAILQQGT